MVCSRESCNLSCCAMENLEEENRVLREKNTELVQQVQYWRMTAAQEKKEKLDLMKDLNDMRLKLSRLRSGAEVEAHKLQAGLQSATEEALNHLVQASGALARSLEVTKNYMRNREELHSKETRWSTLSWGTPTSDSKVNKVPPMLIGGQSIQPVVALQRTLLNSSIRSRTPNQNANATEQAVPMHMLQDVYIPLTRIDMAEIQMSSESDNSTDDLGLQESNGTFEESQNIAEDMDEGRRLDDVMEEIESDDEEVTESERNDYSARIENPLEGPSWLLDRPQTANQPSSRSNLEPDSTTICDRPSNEAEKENEPLSVSLRFTPTMCQLKRNAPLPAPAPLSPRQRHHPNNNRVLKVVVAKMRLSSEHQGGSPPKIAKLISPRTRDTQRRSSIDSTVNTSSPVISLRIPSESTERDGNRARSPKTSAAFDEPSPNGTTDACVVVLTNSQQKNVARRRRAISPCLNVSEDESNIDDNAIEATENINNFCDNDINDNNGTVIKNETKMKCSARNVPKSRNRLYFENDSDENVSKRPNVDRRRNSSTDSESDDDVNDDSECDSDVVIVTKCSETQRGSRRERNTIKDDGDHRSECDSSEMEEFRGFVAPKVSDTHDKSQNVTKSRGKNVTNSRGKNVTNSRGKKVTKSRAKNVTNSRDANINSGPDKNVDVKRNTSEIHDANVTEPSGNSRHDEPNVSGRRTGKSIIKRYASDRQDGNDSDISHQSHDGDTDASTSDFEWGPGRSRRNKKKVTYTEVPLNRKMRR